MCEHHDAARHPVGDSARLIDRRQFLAAATSASAVAMSGLMTAAAAQPDASTSTSIKAVGLAKTHIDKPFERFEFTRRAPGADDVLIEVLYCGVCHTDIHFVDGTFGPLRGPLVPGHEIIGRVREVGRSVSKFKVGDYAGVGTGIDSCGTCQYCQRGLDQYCEKGRTMTYGYSPKGTIQGGYATNILVKESFALKINPKVNLAATAPLLCAGITTYSPMRHWQVKKGDSVAVLGLGGLGHMAVKLAVDEGAHVTVFSSTPRKRDAALAMGVAQFVAWGDQAAYSRFHRQFNYIISTVPVGFEVNAFLPMLAIDGAFVNVGTLGSMEGAFNNALLLSSRAQLSGSAAGGIPETQRMLDYCAERNIVADIELIGPDRIDEAFRRVVAKDVQFRFVLDMSKFRY